MLGARAERAEEPHRRCKSIPLLTRAFLGSDVRAAQGVPVVPSLAAVLAQGCPCSPAYPP